jgi:hypothetical protein
MKLPLKYIFEKVLTTFILISCFCLPSLSQEKNDSLNFKNSIKLDLIPLYYDFFDSRVQVRIGAEYDHNISNNSFVSCYLDAGLYDKYKFIKYYDFFNENLGIYSIQQDISIIGFHIIPGYSYYFYNTTDKQINLFAGAIMDFGYYHKEFESFNSQTLERNSNNYNQKKLGIGLSLGFKNYIGTHIFIELKTSLSTKIFNLISKDERTPIKSLDAQWTSTDYKFWWITNLKIGYAF